MFWGLQVKPENLYKQIVKEAFIVKIAALPAKPSSGTTTLYATVENQEFAICTLSAQIPQQCLDLEFSEGQKVEFKAVGSNSISLSGLLAPVDDFYDDDADDDEYEDEEDEIEDGEDLEDLENSDEFDDEEDLNDSDLQDSEEEEEIPKLVPIEKKKRLVASESDEEDSSEVKEKSKKVKVEQSPKKQQNPAIPSKNAEKSPSLASSSKQGTPNSKSPAAAIVKPTKSTLPGGLVIEDIVIGTGPEAKSNSRIGVYYKGMLTSTGAQFDAQVSGAPFVFTLGTGDVIKGWEMGLKGMRVGGKRKLIIPSHMAYGNKRAGNIPPNSNLTFIVDLKKLLH